MKKIVSIILCITVVLSTFMSSLTFGARAVGTELITDGDFTNTAAIDSASGKITTYMGQKISTVFEPNYNSYKGKWHRLSAGHATTFYDVKADKATAAGVDDYPTYFALNSRTVPEPGNNSNRIMRAVQNMCQFVNVSANKKYTMTFKFRLPNTTSGLNSMNFGFFQYTPYSDTTLVGNTTSVILPITEMTATGVTAVSAGDGSYNLNFSSSASGWQTVTLTFKTGAQATITSGYTIPVTMVRFLMLTDSIAVTNPYDGKTQNYSSKALYFDDMSMVEAADVLGKAEFYDSNSQLITNANDYASVSYTVNGAASSKVSVGDVVAATVDYSANSAYSFIGWYKNGVAFSTQKSINFTAVAGEVYTPRILSKNILSNSASFENYTAGTSVAVSGQLPTSPQPINGLWGYNKNAGYDGNGGTVNEVRDATYLKTKFLPETEVKTGSNALYLGMNYRSATYGFTVQPNTQYNISFDWIAKSANQTGGQYYGICNNYIYTDYNILNPANATMTDPKMLARNAESGRSDGKTWQSRTLSFNSGNNTTLYLVLCGLSDGVASGLTTIAIDNLICTPVQAVPVTVDCKESAAVVPTEAGATPNFGDTYSFKVLTMDTAPVVTYNGATITPDGSGVYSFTAGMTNAIKVVCAGDANRPAAGHDEYGNDLTTYTNNSKVYLTSVWDPSITYQEAAMFYSGRTSVKLLYPVSSIVSLRSYDLQTYYVEGVDYNIVGGKIVLTANSRIPVYSNALTTTTNTGWSSDVPGTYVNIIGDTTFPTMALCITYKHTQKWSDLGEAGYTGTAPTPQGPDISKTLAKLQAGQEVNIVIYGDSISCGWSSSGLNNPATEFKVYNQDCTTLATTSTSAPYVINVAPNAPTWIEMFVWQLRAKYPSANIKVSNLSLGGKDAAWGLSQIKTRLQNLCTTSPDLVLMGWGVNDSNMNGTSAATYKNNCQSIINTIRATDTVHGNPNAEVLFYSPMLPNTDLANYDASFLLSYENALADLANTMPSVGLVKLTSIFSDICSSKQQVDYLNTNLNHPNDFATRIYATSLLAAMGYEKPSYIGASIRPASAADNIKQGMRFTSSIKIDTVASGSIVEFGTVAIRTARLAAGTELTISTANAAHNANYIKNDATLGTPIIRLDNTDATTYWFTGVLVNIPAQYYGSDYTVRSYAVTDTGAYVYGDVVNRSVYNVTYTILHQASQGSSDYNKAMTFVNLDPSAYEYWRQTDPSADATASTLAGTNPMMFTTATTKTYASGVLSDANYTPNDVRIAKALKKAQSGQDITIGIIGGSITQGAGATATSGRAYYQNRYADLVAEWFRQQFPNINVNYYNAGIGSTTSTMAMTRAYNDLLQYNPDFVIVDFTVNDYDTDTSTEAYDNLMYRILSESSHPGVMAIFFTSVDNTVYTSSNHAICNWNANKAITAKHRETCQKYGVPIINYEAALWQQIDKGVIKWTDVGSDYIHPNNVGHKIAANLICNYLQNVLTNATTIATGNEVAVTSGMLSYGNHYLNTYGINNTYTNSASRYYVVSNGAFSNMAYQSFNNASSRGWTYTAGTALTQDVVGLKVYVSDVTKINLFGQIPVQNGVTMTFTSDAAGTSVISTTSTTNSITGSPALHTAYSGTATSGYLTITVKTGFVGTINLYDIGFDSASFIQ